LQFDLYHVARMGLDPAAELKPLLPIVRHIQFADAPGRHEPGTGHVGFEGPLAATAAGLTWLDSWRRGAFGGGQAGLET
jgi:hydroxypyruvate isomerase